MFLGKHGGILGSKKAYEPGNSGATLFARGGDGSSARGKWLNIQPPWGRAVPTPKKNAQANLRVLRQAKAVRLA
jgi:hypothetical protein